MTPVCVAFKAHQGWVNAVAVVRDAALPTPVRADRIDLFDGSDREATEPYHVAGGWHGLDRAPRPQNSAAVIERGRRKQLAAAKRRLLAYREVLASAHLQWCRGVVLTSRGRLSGDLEHILGSHAHIHIAEGEAIRDATRAALRALRMSYVDQDEKSVLETATKMLPRRDCDAYMKARKPAVASAWRAEERLIALAAWLNRD
jgi:hypothetical protein